MGEFDEEPDAALKADPTLSAGVKDRDLSDYVLAPASAAGVVANRPLDLEDVRDLAYRLMNLASHLDAIGCRVYSDNNPDPCDMDLLVTAQKLYNDRRKRNQYLPSDLLSEPAWDIMLDLYINHVQGKEISTSSCCIAACVPTTTALRWISILVKRGLVRHQQSETDHRCMMLSLTPQGVEKMRNILKE